MRAHFEREAEAEWTSYNGSLARPLLNTRKFLNKKKAEEDAPKAVAAAESKS
jgi:hypothetical protein